MKTSNVIRFAVAISFLLGTLHSFAQVNPNLEVGFKPFGSYDGADFDSVNIGTGNLSIFFPLVSYPQRGGQQKVGLVLQYNNKAWGVRQTCNLQTGNCTDTWVWGYPAPPNGCFPSSKGGVNVLLSTNQMCVGYKSYKTASGYTDVYDAVTEDGAMHLLGQNASGAGMESMDLTGVYYGGSPDYSPKTLNVIDRRGVLSPTVNTNSLQDTNGNYLTLGSTRTDTIGRNLIPTGSSADSSGCPANATAWSIGNYPGFSGGSLSVKTCTASYSLKTHFVQAGLDGVIVEGTASTTLLVGVILYNGISWSSSPAWTFDYNSFDSGDPAGTNYGDLTKVTLPTGGTITYVWGKRRMCGSDMTPASRVIVSRTLNDGNGHSYTTAYGNQFPTVVVTDPAQNDTVHTFTGFGCSFYETETKYYSGSQAGGTLLKTVDTAYNYSLSPYNNLTGSSVAINVYPTMVTTTWPANSTWPQGMVSKVETDYDSSFTILASPNFSISAGNVTEKREFANGNGAPGALLRKTDYSYTAGTGVYLNANILGLVTQETVFDGAGNKSEQTTNTYDGTTLQSSGVTKQHASLANPGFRGNLTQVQKWLNTTGGTVTTSKTSYYDTGMPYQSTDLKGNNTTYTYDPAYYGAYLTKTTYPISTPIVAIQGGYDFNTGKLTSFTDENGNPSSYDYDSLWRITSASYPDGGSVGVAYTDTVPVQITKTVALTSTTNTWSNTVFDGLGRVSQTQFKDPNCSNSLNLDYTDFTYTFDTTGHTQNTAVSNPYCTTADSTYGTTTTKKDALGRTISVAEQDNSKIATSYSDDCVTVTDEAGNARKSCSDALGRLTGVWEDPSGKNYETDYGYNVRDNLLSVTQKGGDSNSANWRPRSFVYDSLSRLTSATNPESGTISYTFSSDSTGCAGNPGAVCTRTAPKPNQPPPSTATVTTTYTYDALNRRTKVTYSDGVTPANYYTYDVAPSSGTANLTNLVGRLALSSNQYGGGTSGKATAAYFSYDKMGRVIREWEQTPSDSPNGAWVCLSYDLAGNIASVTPPRQVIAGDATGCDPMGTTISYAHNASGRLTSITSIWSDSQHPPTLYSVDSSLGYWPTGAIRKASFGNGLTETVAFNNRLQPCRMSLNSASAYFSQCSDSTRSGNFLDFTLGYTVGTTDNGNVTSWSGVGNLTFNRSYAYDTLNRIKSMSDSAPNQPCQGVSFTVDAWGNLTGDTGTQGSCYNFSVAVGSNNQLQSGNQYDIAGNLINDGTNSYTYDAENRVTQVNGGSTLSNIYNEFGRRARKTVGSNFTEYYYAPDGNVLMEYNGSSWPTQYVYAGPKLIAEYTNSTTQFIFADHLGSTRLVTGVNQSVIDAIDFSAFGQLLAGGSGTTHLFTGKERDEAALTDFGARYYRPLIRRFMTVDPMSLGEPRAAMLDNPQRWNAYKYGINNPLRFTDRDGRFDAPVHTWLTQESALNKGYSQATVQIMVRANLNVDRPSNFVNNHEHGMSNTYETKASAAIEVAKVIEHNLTDAVSSALKGNYAKAAESLGAGLHTVQDLDAHQLGSLLTHGRETPNDNSAQKVGTAETDSERFLTSFDSSILKALGPEKGEQVLNSVRHATDERQSAGANEQLDGRQDASSFYPGPQVLTAKPQ